jgi:hypothetical protein
MPTPNKAYAPATKPEEPEVYHAHIESQEPAQAAPAPSSESWRGDCLPSIKLSRKAKWQKHQAFTANRQAKVSQGQARESLYRIKHAAINALLVAGCAFVDSVDWSADDATIGVRFVGGGALHTKLSALDPLAFRIVRLQLDDD